MRLPRGHDFIRPLPLQRSVTESESDLMMHFGGRNVLKFLLLLLVCLVAGTPARADENYSDHVFFENSLSPGNYFL